MFSKRSLALSISLTLLFLFFIVPVASAAEPIWTYASKGDEIGGVSISSDGSAIAVAAGKIWQFSRNGTLLGKEPFGEQVVFSRDGSSLVSSYSSTLFLFKRNSSLKESEPLLEKIWDISLPATVQSIDISDDGNTIVASIDSAGTYIFSSTGKIVGSDKRYNKLIRVSSSGTRIAGVSTGVLCQYSRAGICSKSDAEIVGSQPDVMELTSDGIIAIFNDDQRVRSVFLNNKTLRWSKRATGDVTSLAITPDGSKILVGVDNGNIDLFDDLGNISWSYASNPTNKQAAGITSVALSKDASVAVAGSHDGKIFALNSKGEVIWSNQTKDHITHIAMSADGLFVVATGDYSVYAFSVSAQPPPTVRTPIKTATRAPAQSVTTVQENITTQKPLTPGFSEGTGDITAVPTEYSVIRTSTQSPLDGFVSLAGLFVALLLAMRR